MTRTHKPGVAVRIDGAGARVAAPHLPPLRRRLAALRLEYRCQGRRVQARRDAVLVSTGGAQRCHLVHWAPLGHCSQHRMLRGRQMRDQGLAQPHESGAGEGSRLQGIHPSSCAHQQPCHVGNELSMQNASAPTQV